MHFHNPRMGEEFADENTLLGYALDGHPIYGMYPLGDEPSELDACNGMKVNNIYRYHVLNITAVGAKGAGPYCRTEDPLEVVNWNYILGCYKGKTDSNAVQPSKDYVIPDDCKCESWSPDGQCATEITNAPTDLGPETQSPVASPSKVPGPHRRPNIIVMQPDDMQFFREWNPPPNKPDKKKEINFPPNNGMPNLEELRLKSIQFTEAYTASPICGTSRFSTITGKYPSRAVSAMNGSTEEERSDVNIPNTKLEGDDCTKNNLAATFQENGYRTGIVGE